MKLEDIIIHFHKFFDYETYKIFQKAISLSSGINNLRMKDILISIEYFIPYFKKTNLNDETKNKIRELIEIEEIMFNDVIKIDFIRKIFYESIKLSKIKNNLISPEILIKVIIENSKQK